MLCRIVRPAMRVLTIVHEEDAGPGIFDEVLVAAGTDVDTWLVAEQAEPPARPTAYDAIMTFGGSAHPHQEDRHPWLATEKRFLMDALRRQVPLLGICLGAELIAQADGASVQKLAHPEIGWYEVQVTEEGASDPLLGPIGVSFAALEWHSYEVPLPAGAIALADSASCLQAYRLGKCAWGLQFHAEVTAQDFQHWLDNYTIDEDAVAEGIDPQAIASETEGRLSTWHATGRGICERFLRVAAER
jgi:GMP synthase (glutamine-hydrolysing)